jgi:hypothetical protein
MKKSLFFLFAFTLTLLAFNACRKSDDNVIHDDDVMTSEDLAANTDFSEQIDLDADLAVEERGGGNPCPVVTFAQPEGTWPNTITIDYGDGCTRPDGRVLKGIIVVNQTAEIRTAGAVRVVTFENFFVDDVQVEGTKTWTNNGLDAAGRFSYTKTATDMKLSFPDDTQTTWNATHTNTLTEGADTPTHLDNVWSITGNAAGVNRRDQTFSATITEPLIKRASCRWISEGVTVFTRENRTSTLDFGDGTCDRFGSLTLPNGNTISIRLRR